MRCDKKVFSPICLGGIHSVKIFVSQSFDLNVLKDIGSVEKRAVMLGCLCTFKTLLERRVRHICKYGVTWNQSGYQALL